MSNLLNMELKVLVQGSSRIIVLCLVSNEKEEVYWGSFSDEFLIYASHLQLHFFTEGKQFDFSEMVEKVDYDLLVYMIDTAYKIPRTS